METEKTIDQKISKIGVSVEADQSLDRILEKVSTGFQGGKVTKNDLASWVIRYFENECVDSCIEKIRKDHFDHVSYLESIVKEMKKAKKDGTEIPDLPTLLAPIASQIKLISDRKTKK